jgi:hypothetical protein
MTLARWKQANPADQATAILQAIEGDVLNLQAGIGEPQLLVSRICDHLDEVRVLTQLQMPLNWIRLPVRPLPESLKSVLERLRRFEP